MKVMVMSFHGGLLHFETESSVVPLLTLKKTAVGSPARR